MTLKRACRDNGYAICAPAGAAPFDEYIRITTGTLAVIERFVGVFDRIVSELDERHHQADARLRIEAL
jgi:hypothetical protein